MRLLFVILILTSLLRATDIAIVSSYAFDLTSLDKASVSRIFLAKTNRINSTRVKVFELKNSSYKKQFYKEVSGKSLAQLRSYWTRLIFTGKAQPPKQLRNREELIQKMKDDNTVISYLPLNEVTDDMKILYTMRE